MAEEAGQAGNTTEEAAQTASKGEDGVHVDGLAKKGEDATKGTTTLANALFSTEIRQTQAASKELFDAVSARRQVFVAKPGTDDFKFLQMTGADASAGGPGNLSILVRSESPQRLTLMEEFLHGTQSRIWGEPALEASNAVRNFREWHVRDFMYRHQRMFSWDANELSVLNTERAYYRGLVDQGKK